MKRPLREAPHPVEVDTRRIVLIGTGVWLVALVALLVSYQQLEETGRLHWIWICVAGIALGLVGLFVAGRQRRARRNSEGLGP